MNSCFVSASSPGALESAGAVGCVPAMKVRWACILLLALTVSVGPARRVRAEVIRAEEERLIGWLGEVPRPNSGGADARDRAAEIVTTDERGVRYDASTLDTDHIGVGNPNVEKLSDEPKAFLYHGFLSAEECDHLIKIGTPHLKRSTVVGGKDDTGVLDDVRTSFGTFLPKKYDDVLYGIERRVEDFSQISYENQEQLQLLKYHDGQEYKDHQDGLTSPNGGRRIATVLIFLHEPEKGGETSFPQGKPLPAVAQRLRGMRDELSECAWRDGRGLAVKPRRGDAVLFFSFKKNGGSDIASTHASCPTVGGVKWTATKWIHEKRFDTGVWREPKCVDEEPANCPGWAKSGECANNPAYMLGGETPGKCLRSCCTGDVGTAMPETLSAWQRIFCASCPGTRWKEEVRAADASKR